jgi:hypothetical protein
MFSIYQNGRWSRREMLRVGGLSTLGVSLPHLLRAKSAAAESSSGVMFGRAKNVIFLWLQGGPPQHETFDPKPDAPLEIRGEFKPISTNVPGIQIGELLPRTAAMADKYAIVRSLETHSDLHDASGYWVLTGYKYTGQESRKITRATDWPYLGSVIRMLAPSKTLPAYTSVWLPDMMRLNDNVTPAGQTGGFLGMGWDPARIICDPSDPNFQVEGLALPPEIPALRFTARQSLLSQVERHFDRIARGPAVDVYDRQTQESFDLLTSGRSRQAFDLNREPQALREKYGLHEWGQSVLLSRRLIEAGARLVHVNWPREKGDEAVNNPMWDTHAQNSDRLQEVLCPLFDVTYTALLEDLEQRGLLDETLVVVIGEFGRTPKINSQGGRDHWGHVFSFLLAGAGIRGGQVYGSSDAQGAYPRDNRLEPQDLTATILHLLGIGHQVMFRDLGGRPQHATLGEPLYPLLGEEPATRDRCVSEGNVNLVPPYSKAPIFESSFEENGVLAELGSKQRFTRWMAKPQATTGATPDFGVALIDDPAVAAAGLRCAALGIGLSHANGQPSAAMLPAGTRAVVTQQIRNPRAGTYVVKLKAACGGAQADWDWLAANFQMRLSLFGYRSLDKNPWDGVREYASVPLTPQFAQDGTAGYQEFQLTRALRSQDAGAAEIEMGVGLAVWLERKTPGELAIDAARKAYLRIDDFAVTFTPRPRNDNVTV